MSEPDDPIEIELVSDGSTADDDDVGRSPTRSKVPAVGLATLVLVALVALVAGVVVGRVSAPDADPDPEADDPPAPASEPRVDDGGAALDTVPIDDTVTSVATDGPGAAALDEAITTVTAVEVEPRLAGLDLRLVGLGAGMLHELDLATGELTNIDHPRLSRRGELPQRFRRLLAGEDWVAVADQWEGGYLVFRDGEAPIDVAGVDLVAGVPGTDRLWVGDEDGFVEVELDGEPTGAKVSYFLLDGAIVVDPGGGLIVDQGDRLFTIDDAGMGSSLLPVGDPLSISAGFVVLHVCDADMPCSVKVVDRTTREEREVPFEAGSGANPIGLRSMFGIAEAPSVAPGGERALVLVAGRSTFGLEILDLTTGERMALPIPDAAWSASAEWSPDGRYVFFSDGTELMAADAVTGETLEVLPNLEGTWYQLTARPGGESGG